MSRPDNIHVVTVKTPTGLRVEWWYVLAVDPDDGFISHGPLRQHIDIERDDVPNVVAALRIVRASLREKYSSDDEHPTQAA